MSKPTVFMYKGLPASGKTTQARMLVNENPEKTQRVNKDDLRVMFPGLAEQHIVQVEDTLIAHWVSRGIDVIVDDTNLNPYHEQRLRKLTFGRAYFRVVDQPFMDVPVEECIRRDQARDRSVGASVIQGMYDKFIKPTQSELYVPDVTMPKAFICDLDGTIALNEGHRGFYEYSRVSEDILNRDVAEVVHALVSEGMKPVFLSGRDEACYIDTKRWIERHLGLNDIVMFMRPHEDHRKDSIVKRELFDKHVRNMYNVRLVLDDRQQVVDMWRSLGLTCLQVAPGDF